MYEHNSQRHHNRLQLGRPLILERWSQERGSEANVHFEVQGSDVSSGGIGIVTPQPLKIGEVVKVAYPLDVPGGGVMLPVFAEVVWTREVEGIGRTGLRFLM